MKRYLHGIHVAGHKSTAQMSAVKLPLPDSVVIPMAMHIGAPAKPVVKVGDYVKTGQLIGEPGGFVSAPIYASVSGTVKKIGEMLGSNGRMMQTVEIESDGLDARWEGIQPPKLETMQDFLDAVRASGLVGLGGAGFPTVVKLTVKNLDQIKCVIINGSGVRALHYLRYACDDRLLIRRDCGLSAFAEVFEGTAHRLRH